MQSNPFNCPTTLPIPGWSGSVLPCIGTMLFTSIYGIVDGLCVSNFVGKTAFAAVNLIMPLPMLIGTVGCNPGYRRLGHCQHHAGRGRQQEGR